MDNSRSDMAHQESNPVHEAGSHSRISDGSCLSIIPMGGNTTFEEAGSTGAGTPRTIFKDDPNAVKEASNKRPSDATPSINLRPNEGLSHFVGNASNPQPGMEVPNGAPNHFVENRGSPQSATELTGGPTFHADPFRFARSNSDNSAQVPVAMYGPRPQSRVSTIPMTHTGSSFINPNYPNDLNTAAKRRPLPSAPTSLPTSPLMKRPRLGLLDRPDLGDVSRSPFLPHERIPNQVMPMGSVSDGRREQPASGELLQLVLTKLHQLEQAHSRENGTLLKLHSRVEDLITLSGKHDSAICNAMNEVEAMKENNSSQRALIERQQSDINAVLAYASQQEALTSQESEKRTALQHRIKQLENSHAPEHRSSGSGRNMNSTPWDDPRNMELYAQTVFDLERGQPTSRAEDTHRGSSKVSAEPSQRYPPRMTNRPGDNDIRGPRAMHAGTEADMEDNGGGLLMSPRGKRTTHLLRMDNVDMFLPPGAGQRKACVMDPTPVPGASTRSSNGLGEPGRQGYDTNPMFCVKQMNDYTDSDLAYAQAEALTKDIDPAILAAILASKGNHRA